MRVLVLGAGVAGLLLAAELAGRGVDVEVSDPLGVGAGASGRASGILSLQAPEPLLTWVLEGMEYYDSLGVSTRLPGVLAAPRGCIDEMRGLEAWGVEVRDVPEAEAAGITGLEARLPEGWALAYTLDAVVDVGALLSRLLSLLPRPPRPAELSPFKAIESGFDYVIVAAGAWTPGVLGVRPEDLAGSRIYNCEASSARVPGSLRALVYVEDGGYAYAVPEAPGRVIVGDGPNRPLESPYTSRPDPETPYRVLETLATVFPAFLDSYPEASWSAPCLIAGDGLPIVGEWLRGIYVLTGLDGYGLMAAPALARMLAEHLTSGAPLPALLDPHREVEPWSGEGEPPEPFRGCGPG